MPLATGPEEFRQGLSFSSIYVILQRSNAMSHPLTVSRGNDDRTPFFPPNRRTPMTRNNHITALVPFTPAAMVDVWKVGVMAFELWTTSLSTIAMRNNLWYTQVPTSARMMKENQRMVTEKLDAGMEVATEMNKAMLNMFSGQHAPWWVTSQRALKPFHRRTTANSRRLSR